MTEVMAPLGTALGLLGALGVFVFGMKLMSEALQKLAGARLKALLAHGGASNRTGGLLTGIITTSVVQSSSATTVMVVGFVTAGLLTLSQAVGVILGANVGTTLTGWLVAVLGFEFQVAFALPAAGLGFVLTFMRGARVRQWGEALLGFGLLFIGLGFLISSVPPPGPEGLEWVAHVETTGFVGTLAFLLIGAVLTVVLQSSSATLTLTMALAAAGWVSWPLAAAMVLGENIGTTATANLAAIGTPLDARRAARAHFAVNALGAGWAVLLLGPVLVPTIEQVLPGGGVALRLALFHTLFNVLNVAVSLALAGPLEALVSRWVGPERDGDQGTLRYLGTETLIDTPELVLVAAGQEMHHMAVVARTMLQDAVHILSNPDVDLGQMVKNTLSQEGFIDDLERQISHHLALTARAATSATAARRVAAMVQNTHRLERIGDHCAVLVRVARRLRTAGERMPDADLKRIEELGGLVERSLEYVARHLDGEQVSTEAEALEVRIDQLRAMLRNEQVERLRGGEHSVRAGLALLDVLSELEEIGDRAIGIIRHAEYTATL
jgi:phosphate:Na+ symporter